MKRDDGNGNILEMRAGMGRLFTYMVTNGRTVRQQQASHTS